MQNKVCLKEVVTEIARNSPDLEFKSYDHPEIRWKISDRFSVQLVEHIYPSHCVIRDLFKRENITTYSPDDVKEYIRRICLLFDVTVPPALTYHAEVNII
jgi:hypothetical protein